MADLSSLLNPAPSSEGLAREAQIAERHVGHSGGKPPNLPPVQIGALSLQPSMKSPLDTLADAATSSAPMLSPTNPNGTSYMSFGPYRHLPGRPSSRPTSSRITPPLAYDQSHAPAPTSPTFSPGLQQYHHPTSSEVRARRASEAAETSIGSLPPLRRPFSDNGHPGSTDQFGPPLHQDESALPILPGIDAAAALVDEQPAEAREGPTPVTSQIRQASPGPSIPAQDLNLPPTQSEQAPVKTEIDSTPDFNSTSIQPPAPAPEPPYEHNQETESAPPTVDMKPKSSPAPSNASAQNNMLKPQPAPSRKRPAPKKGTATAVKPAAKRRKVEKPTETIEKTSPLARSGTPYSSRASKTPAPKNRKQASVTPQRSSSVANDDEDEDEDEDGVFCICRGPDNHTWMIACDGPCEDWFHGRCIDMTEKEGELIEKYYCPNCTEGGKGETLWKRMCRLEGCRKPARINGNSRSKYCSDEHGCEFMKRMALQDGAEGKVLKAGVTPLPDTPAKKGRRTNNSFANVDLSNGNDTPTSARDSNQHSATKEGDEVDGNENRSHPRGGILRPGELKALVTNVKDISEFRKLGDGVLSPPPTANPTERDDDSKDIKMEDSGPPPPSSNEPSTDMNNKIPYNPAETSHLQTIAAKKDELRTHKQSLDDRDIFLTLVRERAKGVLDELKKKENVKDICGFDVRLVWLDEEFDIWRNSPEGIKALDERKLGPPTGLVPPQQVAPQANGEIQQQPNAAVNGDTAPAPPRMEQKEEDELGAGICKKKKCERHRNWYKIQQQEIAFAKGEVRQGMRKLEEEEKGVRDCARIRWLTEGEDHQE